MSLDAHYEGFTDDGNRLQVTAFGVTAPVPQVFDNEKWLKASAPRMELVAVHTHWGDDSEDMDHTWRTGCFRYDPRFDGEESDDDVDA